MNADKPQPEELESKLTGLLLGELPEEEAAALRRAIEHDTELSRLYRRLETTIGLVRQTAAMPAEPAAVPAEPLKLQDQRREKLLAHFKTVRPPEFAKPRKRQKLRLAELSVAAGLVALIGVAAAFLFSPIGSVSRHGDVAVNSPVEQLQELARPRLRFSNSEREHRETPWQTIHQQAALEREAQPHAPVLSSDTGPITQIILPPVSELAQAASPQNTRSPMLATAPPSAATSVGGGAISPGTADGSSVHEGQASGIPSSGQKEEIGSYELANADPQDVQRVLSDLFDRSNPRTTSSVNSSGSLLAQNNLLDQRSTGALTPPANSKPELAQANPEQSVPPQSTLGFAPSTTHQGPGKVALRNDSAPVVTSGALDPATGLPVGEVAAPPIDPATGLPIPVAAPTATLPQAGEPGQYARAYDGAGESRRKATDSLSLVTTNPISLAEAATSTDKSLSGLRGGETIQLPAGFGGAGGGGGSGGGSPRVLLRNDEIADRESQVQQTLDAGGVIRPTTDLDALGRASKALKHTPPGATGKTEGQQLAQNETPKDAYWAWRDKAPNASEGFAYDSGQASFFKNNLADTEGSRGAQTQSTNVNLAFATGAQQPNPDTNIYSLSVVGYVDHPLALSKYALGSNPLDNTTNDLNKVPSRDLQLQVQQPQKDLAQLGDMPKLGKLFTSKAATTPETTLREPTPAFIGALDDSKQKEAKSESAQSTRLEAEKKDLKERPARKSADEPQPELQTSDNAFSTFSLNVSDVSFRLAAASLDQGQMPEPANIRSEEFINAFDYRDPEPAPGAPLAFAWERAAYPFAQNRDLLRFSVKTAALGRTPGRPLNIVLLLDNSGSMERADRVQIIREALRVLAAQLQPQDKFSIVTFARTARLWVDGVPGNQAGQAAEEVSKLTPQGGTNLEEAMRLAYQTALRHYLANGDNRVVLLTDGAANLGIVDPVALKQNVEAHRKQGIALDCFGIGWEGFNDNLLEVISRNGNGRYGFLNTPEEAANDFAGQLAGALHVAASDVKVQVEFNPRRVTAYRQIGYARHQLTKQQFRDNTVNAAQIGAAESGNALYVIEANPAGEGPLGTVRVRYRVPGTTEYHEHEWEVPYTGKALALDQSSPAMRLAATAAAFSEWLASSPYAGEVTPDRLLGYLRGVPEVCGADARPRKLQTMIQQAQSLAGGK